MRGSRPQLRFTHRVPKPPSSLLKARMTRYASLVLFLWTKILAL